MGRVLRGLPTKATLMPVQEREFQFTVQDFELIRHKLRAVAGITLSDQKMPMVYGRLSRRVRELQLTSFADYLTFLEQHAEEYECFINAMTTNKTHFFRESHHFDYLAQTLIPRWRLEPQHPVHIWSTACSTGEEPYSIAATLLASGEDLIPRVKVLATDLDTKVLATAREGIYDASAVSGIPAPSLKAGFVKGKGPYQGVIQPKQRCRDLVLFKQLNLFADWPFKYPMDVIFCRNVLIYFDKPTQHLLLERFWQLLAPGGVLFLGHSESLGPLANQFSAVGQTVYTKH